MLVKCTGCRAWFNCIGRGSCLVCGIEVDRPTKILAALDVLGLQILSMNRVTICDDVAKVIGAPRDSVSYDEVVAALLPKVPNLPHCPACLTPGKIGDSCPSCPGFWYADPATPNSPTPNSPTPNSNTELIVKDHPKQRPGKWFALVEINADPAATAQQVRDDICDILMVDFDEGTEHCLQSVSVLVNSKTGLHPDEGNDQNTVYWP